MAPQLIRDRIEELRVAAVRCKKEGNIEGARNARKSLRYYIKQLEHLSQ